MDHSMNSCGGKASSSSSPSSSSYAANKDTISYHEEEEEESGWTSYFEDFSKSREQSHHHYCSSLDGGDGGSSLLSDAASYATCKFSHHNNNNNNNNNNKNNHNHNYGVIISSSRAAPNLPKKLCFKKAIRAKHISSEDDPLEDTASSPVNSPKVANSSPRDEIISSKIDGSMGGKGSTSSEHNNSDHLEIQDEEHELNFHGKSIECRELKKRGLCLVPLSMLVNYLG